MSLTLETLSKREHKLYGATISLKGTIDELAQQLLDSGINGKYSEVHRDYFKLFNQETDDRVRLEILKRLVFLNWYSMVEPGIYTGLDGLRKETIANSYTILNEFIEAQGLDNEFSWMLSYYASWDWAILTVTGKKLDALTKFIEKVDTSVAYAPKHQLPKGTMHNRGHMGIYWASLSVEIE